MKGKTKKREGGRIFDSKSYPRPAFLRIMSNMRTGCRGWYPLMHLVSWYPVSKRSASDIKLVPGQQSPPEARSIGPDVNMPVPRDGNPFGSTSVIQTYPSPKPPSITGNTTYFLGSTQPDPKKEICKCVTSTCFPRLTSFSILQQPKTLSAS